MNIAEKILASHAGLDSVKPGDIVTCNLDYAAAHDMFFLVSGQGDFSKASRVWDKDRVLIFQDHGVPSPTTEDADGALKARAFVRKHELRNFFDVGNHGVIHQKIAEEGFALPGKLIAGGDSHTCAAGAFNAAARGFGPADMLYCFCTGQTWYQVGGSVLYRLSGRLPDMVTAKDVFLHIAGVYGEVTGQNVEFGGDGIATLTMAERQSIATMCAEINADFAIFPYDDVLEEYVIGRAKEGYTPVAPDADAEYDDIREVNLSDIVPQVTGAHYIPLNSKPVTDSLGLSVQQAVLGSCSNGRLEDIALAAKMIAGHKVADGTRFIVTPASSEVWIAAAKAGYLETLAEAGAVVTNATCGACYGGHMGLIGAGERCISTTTRNFKGRMGSPDSEVLLAGPATVTASAIMGKVTDPREFGK